MSDDAALPTPAAPESPMPVPPLLRDIAAWTWRLLLLALAGYLFVELLDRLYFVVLPFFGALFVAALGHPVVNYLSRRGLARALATWIAVIVAAVIVGGISIFVVDRAISEYPDLVSQVNQAVLKFRHFLTVDLHVRASSTASLEKTITTYLSEHQSSIASGALSGITTLGEALAAFVLWFFMSFFLVYDGHNIWSWFVRLLPPPAQVRAQRAGGQAWDRLGGFVRGTFIIAIFHAIVIAIALTAMGVPLVAPLALLVFVGSFLPIIGAFAFGGLAVAITFVTQGWILGLVLIGVLVIDNQIEAHVFQPFLVGRYVQLHPLAVAVAIAGGGLLEGIYGAVLAVPFVAVVYAVLHSLATGGAPPPEAPPAGGGESLGGDPPPDEGEKKPAKSARARRPRAAAKPRPSTAD